MDSFKDQRELTIEDLQLMLLPESFYSLTVDDLPTEEAAKLLDRYAGKLKSAFDNKVGLLITGPADCGKEEVAAIIAKVAASFRKTGMYISVSDLRDSLIRRVNYNADKSAVQRAKEVDLLILTGLEETDSKEKFLSLKDIASLVRARANRFRLTIITTDIQLAKFEDNTELNIFLKTVRTVMQPFGLPAPETGDLSKRKALMSSLVEED